ncbi:hypothetical protein CDAR_93311 [Caerostris darwini]|uniref:Ribosomal protein S14 n=1 Tax=Caerostris darwini TaxID=1538125 RepID=A0AAV4QC47_9ARAC|nr:hypothetical protein CDAR_93311 [Caerostris darwini]
MTTIVYLSSPIEAKLRFQSLGAFFLAVMNLPRNTSSIAEEPIRLGLKDNLRSRYFTTHSVGRARLSWRAFEKLRRRSRRLMVSRLWSY